MHCQAFPDGDLAEFMPFDGSPQSFFSRRPKAQVQVAIGCVLKNPLGYALKLYREALDNLSDLFSGRDAKDIDGLGLTSFNLMSYRDWYQNASRFRDFGIDGLLRKMAQAMEETVTITQGRHSAWMSALAHKVIPLEIPSVHTLCTLTARPHP